MLSAAGIFMRTVSVAFNVYVSGKVGAEGMGLLTLVSSVYGFAITFATSGINIAVVRLVSSALPPDSQICEFDKKSNASVGRIMRGAICYCLLFGFLSSFILFISANNIGIRLLNDIRTVPSLKFLSFSLIPIAVSSAINGYFCAVRRVYKNVCVQFCEQCVKIFTVTALLLTIAPSGLEYACIAVVGGGALSEGASVIINGILYLFDRKIHKKSNENYDDKKCFLSKFGAYIPEGAQKNVGFSKKESQGEKGGRKSASFGKGFSEIFSVAFPVAVGAYVRSALVTIEHLAIPWGLKRSGFNASRALASYGVLHGMVFPLLLFPSAVLGAFASLLVPELSSSQSHGETKRIKYIVSRVFSLTLLFSIGVSGIFICYSYEIGTYLYSSTEAAEFIKMLSPLIPLMYLDGAVDTMLKGLGHQLYTMRVNIADSLISILLLLIFLPNYGIQGYIAVIFITELFNTSFSIIKLLNVTGVQTPVIKWVAKPLITVVAATAVSRILFDFNVISKVLGTVITGKPLAFTEIGVTAVLYILLSALFGAISKDDIRWAKSVVHNP